MKNVLIAFAIMTSVLSFSGNAATDPLELVGDRCAPGDVLFYGQTTNHKKEVLVCQWNTNIFYQFGKIGQNPEKNIKLDVSEVNVLTDDNQSTRGEYLMIRSGDTIYQVGQGTDVPSDYTYGLIKVIQYGKGPLAEILLDDSTVVNGIHSNFVKQGQ
ncbi:adhesin [Kosakonia phage Kc263]|uniref:Adhesin n=1 Tax=Kosakonia phage Kc263 TaxID=2863194 RepID=A0AAE7WF40_9CAUD|nr:adhesin [Kosakonia phage Kc263]QYN79908.1 adhesin [Kosakonia phage Kc263]